MSAADAGQRFTCVLSAGRAGTTSLREHLRARCPAATLRFEPPPSRQLFVLWNVERAGWLPAGTAARLLPLAARGPVSGARVRVDFHSYLCPLLCASPHLLAAAHLVHVVRDPYDWITSIGNFKAASWRRHVVGRLPFTSPVHPLARDGWRRLGRIERLAWMWRLVNESILALREAGASYRRVRFEDLVSPDPTRRAEQLGRILHVIDPGLAAPGEGLAAGARLNSSGAGSVPGPGQWEAQTLHRVTGVCAGLMQRFGYPLRGVAPAR